MDEKAAKQQETGGNIQRLLSNYKKDGPDRKTLPYFQKLTAKLDELWEKFESMNTAIQEEHPTELLHAYHVNMYFDSVKRVYSSYREEFSAKMKELEKQNKVDTAKIPLQEEELNTGGDSTKSEGQAILHSSQSEDMQRLSRKQETIISSLRRALNNAKHTGKSKQFYDLQEKTIQRHWMQIEEIHNSIGGSTEAPEKIGYNQGRFIELEEEVHNVLISLAQQLETSLLPHQPGTTTPKMNLPKITLPKFDGDYLKWPQFHDLFTQMVDKQKMSSCEKMFYLKTNLTGEAERVIRHVALSEENYSAAWKLLQARYSNPRLQVSALLNRLLGQPSRSSDAASAAALKDLHDTTQECMHGLTNLGLDIAEWDPILLHILTKKLDKSTHTLYEQTLTNPKELQPLDEFLKFLETRFQSLEALSVKGNRRDIEKGRRRYPKATSSITIQNKNCTLCKSQHQLYSCRTFLNLTPLERLNHVRKNNLCVNCLQDGHTSFNCRLRGCLKCAKKHNSLVHLPKFTQPKSSSSISISGTKDVAPPDPEPSTTSEVNNAILAALSTNKKEGYVFLSTVIIHLIDQDGSPINCRAILDSGSQINIVTERMIRKLNIPLSSRPMIIQGIGNSKRDSNKRANICLKSTTTNFTTRLEAIVLPQIVSPQPTHTVDISTWKFPRNVVLADPQFNQRNNIDLLIGAEFYHQLLCVGQIKLGTELPLLQNTLLGWIVTGKMNEDSSRNTVCGIATEESSLEQTISKFWQTEELLYPTSSRTIAEEKCEEHFYQSTSRDATGRYVVSLPFAEDANKLGSSSDIALSRFHALERRLDRRPELYNQYRNFMDEYIQLGHMTEIDFKSIPTPHYFLPHHCVLKPESSSTKLRVVFDASAKTSTNLSLNDLLYSGPTIQDELFSILLRFRLPKFVIKADIQKMYRQILIREEDQQFQLIWWRPNRTEPIKCYKLHTVTYGTTSAPYLATKCLQVLATEYSAKYPLGSQVLLKDFYVDDVMAGADSIVAAKDIQSQLSLLLREGGLQLKKWCSNHQQLLDNIPLEDQEIPLTDDNNEGAVKTLGLIWRPKSDVFCIKTNYRTSKRFTKRSVASDIARLFDPLGIVAPVVIVAKLFLQELWELKYDWDASLPEEMYTRWNNYYQGLQELDKFQIPRHVFGHYITSSMQMHTFADASEKAYGAAVYIRSVNKDGTIVVRLLCSKSRVAPTTKTASGMRSMTIPRLELCAALLAAELSKRVKSDLKLDNTNSFLWSDSQIVLSWINSNSESFQTFVGRRIANIQSLTSTNQWRYVKSAENPADVLSRGISPEKLQDHTLWKYGPRFLHGSESIWPPPYKLSKIWTDERKEVALLTTNDDDHVQSMLEGIKHSNSFNKLNVILAYCFRFVHLCKSGKLKDALKSVRQPPKKGDRTAWSLSTSELEISMQFIIKEVQNHGFHKDIRFLKAHKELDKESPLKGLAVFLDQDDLLRVGGRLQASNLPYDSKHPMLLPYSHPLVKMLMTDLHFNNNHIGPQGLLAITRQRFWPIKGKNIARSIVQHCIFCVKAKPKMYSQIMGNLPAPRVQPSRPFINTGVDFCERKRRNDKSDPSELSSSKAARKTTTQTRADSTNPNFFTTLLLIGLILPTVIASDIEVIKFNNASPGIHFQRHGTISLIHHRWNLVVYYNLEPYMKEFQALDNSTTILDHICNKLSSKELCSQVIQQLRLITHELDEDNIIPSNKSSVRIKRGAIDVVGNIANSLFGVLDSKYANEMSQRLESIQSNEDQLMNLLKNHTSILDSTVNIMKLSQDDMSKRQHALDNQLSQLFNRVNNVTEELYQSKLKELFLSWCTHATLIIINIQRMQTSITDVLADTHQGRVNHLLITYQQLKIEVGKIRSHLPPGLRIPVEPDQILQLYKLMNVEGHVSSNHIVFNIELPLLGLEEFIAYKLIPIPAAINNSYITIQLSTDVLAVSAHHDQYYPITEDELSRCTTTNGDHHLCRQTHPVYQAGTNLSLCEISLLNNKSDLSTCELKMIKANSVWTKLPELNQWIFAVNEETMLNVVCKQQTSFIALEGNGLLKLQPYCVAKNKHLTLQGQQIYSSKVQASYTRLIQDVPFQRAIQLATLHYNMSNTSSLNQELNELRDQIRRQQLELPNHIRYHNIPHSIVSSLGLLITIAIVGFLVYKRYCQKHPPPIPAPRRTRSSSYTISI